LFKAAHALLSSLSLLGCSSAMGHHHSQPAQAGHSSHGHSHHGNHTVVKMGEPVHVGGSVAAPGAYGGMSPGLAMGGGMNAPATAMMAPAPMMTTMAAPTMTAMPTSAAPAMGAMPAMMAPAMTTMAAPTMAAMPAMTTMAAPAVTAMPAMPSYGAGYGGGSFVGAPMTAPAMTTMAAPTMAAMPAMTAMAAPAMAAMPSYGGGSFVAAPPMPAYGAAMPPTGPPQRLTAGMPDPASIEHQKLQYSRAIDLELQKEAQQVQAQAQQQKQMLMMRSKQEKAQSYLTIDQYATYGNMYVDDQTLAEIAYLQEESAQHRQILEQQASALALEYNQKKAQEDMMMRQYQIQKQYYENSQRLHGMQSEVQRGVIPQGLFGGSVAQAAGMVPGMSMVTGATQQAVGAGVGATNQVIGAGQRTASMIPGQSMVAGGAEMAGSTTQRAFDTGVGVTQQAVSMPGKALR